VKGCRSITSGLRHQTISVQTNWMMRIESVRNLGMTYVSSTSNALNATYDRVMKQEWSEGVVRDFDDLEGVGVIESPATPGGCWFHYSMIEVSGRRTLTTGQRVDFTFEHSEDQDGYATRAVRVRPLI